MTPGLFYAVVGALICSLAAAQLLCASDLLKRIIAINLLGTGIFIILIAIGYREGGPPDPVTHALVLTGIVVAVSATGLALALASHLSATGEDGDV